MGANAGGRGEGGAHHQAGANPPETGSDPGASAAAGPGVSPASHSNASGASRRRREDAAQALQHLQHLQAAATALGKRKQGSPENGGFRERGQIYSNEELHECLRAAFQENGRPTLSSRQYQALAKKKRLDNRRKWPTYETIVRRFGSWSQAFRAAGIPEGIQPQYEGRSSKRRTCVKGEEGAGREEERPPGPRGAAEEPQALPLRAAAAVTAAAAAAGRGPSTSSGSPGSDPDEVDVRTLPAQAPAPALVPAPTPALAAAQVPGLPSDAALGALLLASGAAPAAAPGPLAGPWPLPPQEPASLQEAVLRLVSQNAALQELATQLLLIKDLLLQEVARLQDLVGRGVKREGEEE